MGSEVNLILVQIIAVVLERISLSTFLPPVPSQDSEEPIGRPNTLSSLPRSLCMQQFPNEDSLQNLLVKTTGLRFYLI